MEDGVLLQPIRGAHPWFGLDAGTLGPSFTTLSCVCCVNIVSNEHLLKVQTNKKGAPAKQDLHLAGQSFTSHPDCASLRPSNQSKDIDSSTPGWACSLQHYS